MTEIPIILVLPALPAVVGLAVGLSFGKLLHDLDKRGCRASEWCMGLATGLIAAYFGYLNFGWLGLSGLLAVYPGYRLFSYHPWPAPAQTERPSDQNLETFTISCTALLGCGTGVATAIAMQSQLATGQGVALALVGTILLVPVSVGAFLAAIGSVICVCWAIGWCFRPMIRFGGWLASRLG
jgi:hypothetical protein